jgi:hypothetical protein
MFRQAVEYFDPATQKGVQLPAFPVRIASVAGVADEVDVRHPYRRRETAPSPSRE